MQMLTILLMAGQGGAQGGGSSMLIMMLAMVAVFYFFMIRPQSKKAKEQKKYRENIKKGDRIVTIGGVHGKIVDVKETTFIIEVEGGGRLKIEKVAVSTDYIVKDTDSTETTKV